MTRKVLACQLLVLLIAGAASADVSMVERRALHQSKRLTKVKPGRPPGRATGSQGLIDASGVKYFINTNITFSTSSSASGAASEASYTHAVAATTLNGGTTSSTLNDAFDGYNTMCISLNNTVATCETGNANFVIYNKNGPATTECPGTASGVNRQVVFPVQVMEPGLSVQRKVFVPDNDSFARWLNYFTNTGATPLTVTMVVANNLGSDSNTVIFGSSNGNTTAEVSDTWVGTFQNYSGTTSSDPRLGHVLQSTTPPTVPLTGINFANGDDNPFWGYTFTLAPGETKIIANFSVVAPSKTAAAAKSTELAGAPVNALQCLSTVERAQLANFAAAPFVTTVPTLGGIGLFALAALLALAATVLLFRRRSASA